MDAITGADIAEGRNALRFERDSSTDDDFAIGTVTVHWRNPSMPTEIFRPPTDRKDGDNG